MSSRERRGGLGRFSLLFPRPHANEQLPLLADVGQWGTLLKVYCAPAYPPKRESQWAESYWATIGKGQQKSPPALPLPLPCLHFMIRLQSAGAADDDYVPLRVFILGGRVVRPKNVSTVHRIARNAPDRSKQG